MNKFNLFISSMPNMSLVNAANAFVKTLNNYEKHYALLYSPHKCFLALVDRNSNFRNEQNDEIDVKKESIYEARVFNSTAELRWLNKENGIGKTVILSENPTKKFFLSDSEPFHLMSTEFAATVDQSYLIWGKNINSTSNGWTKFGTARIGAFYVPEAITTDYAQFTAVEYLKEFEDGNIAMFDERLTGISEVKNDG